MTEKSGEYPNGNRSGPDAPSKPVLELDFEKYEPLLADETIPDAQKRELIETLWSIITQFVALGFELHPIQIAQQACGQHANTSDQSALSPAFMVDCQDSNTNKEKPEMSGQITAEGR